MKIIVKSLLGFFSRRILHKYKPEIVAVTGSVGKTSAREAIYTVLKDEFPVRQSYKNMNTEIGVPLVIIGFPKFPGKSIAAWLAVFTRALGLLMSRRDYPKVLILEMALDHPGDIEYLTRLAPPKVGVVTAIGSKYPVHVEFFKNADELVDEKMLVLTRVPKKGFAIINRDDAFIWKRRTRVVAQTLSFGVSDKADMIARNIRIAQHLDPANKKLGLYFKLEHQGANVPIFLPGILGEHQANAALVAAAVGRAYDINLVTIAERLKNIRPIPGRMHLLKGIKDTLIIDDTYNASPAATQAALHTLGAIDSQGRKIAVLADMAELGPQTETAHALIGKEVVAQGVDMLITVGEKAKMIGDAAAAAGMAVENIFSFARAEEAGIFAQERMMTKDIVLVKGSQSMRMERVVKEIMGEPLRAEELLVRQSKDWLRTP